MNKFSIVKLFFLVASFFIISCDKDFNVIGSDIVDENNFLFEKYNTSSVLCYNQFDAAVQTNNLAINQLGIYTNPGFGKTTASFVTQVELDSVNKTIGTEIEMLSAELTVPYFSSVIGTDSDGKTTYVLDSIYGTKTDDIVTGKIKLEIYESTKFLNTYDGMLDFKRYYSDEGSVFESNTNPTLLFNQDDFTFSPLYQTETSIAQNKTGTETTTDVTPRMKIQLNKLFFQDKLLSTSSSGKLLNNTVFKEYFRGLHFKVSSVGQEEALALLNFAAGKITIQYKEKVAIADTEKTNKTLVINLTGNTVNLLENSYTETGLPTSTEPSIAGENLYLKGGAGFHSYIDLFGAAVNGVVPDDAPELINIKNQNWIINEANLVFTVNNAARNNSTLHPNRVYLYDAVNKRQIIDYALDQLTNPSNPKFAKSIYGGIVYEEEGQTKYKIRITNHIKNLVNKDSTNVRLGLVVTENINNVSNLFIKNIAADKYYNRLPNSSVINPLSTILYGSDPLIEDSKRLKLEIFYTKPN